MNTQSELPNELKAQFFKRWTEKYERCLWPFDNCRHHVSKAHSIQNSRVLDMLQKNGHVIMPQITMAIETGPAIHFKEVSRHKASTFTGLCNRHDSEIFRRIDIDTFDREKPEHLFLIAYRSVIKEYHTTLEGVQSAMGLISDITRAEISNAAMERVHGRIMDSYETYLYWMKLNNLIEEANYGGIEHKIIDLPSTRASIAVSSMFALEIQRQRIEVAPSMIINITPEVNGKHTAILSYLPEHKKWSDSIFSRLKKETGIHLLLEMSKLILERCENFVLAKDMYERFSDNKKLTILKYYSGNCAGDGRKMAMDSGDLMLFE